jgi:hypothetical protein
MEETDKAEFEILVSMADSTDEELDRFTRQLLSELRELNVESAELVKGDSAPKGSKGDPIAIGSIVISTLPTILPAVITLVQSWSARGQGRTIKFKGKGIEFEGTPEELEKLLTALEKQKKKRK